VTIDEVRERLGRFAQAHIGPEARIVGLEPGPGHAGFSYLFDVESTAGLSRYYLRLPPSGVKWEGPADMKRHVTALRALEGSAVPHPPLIWEGDDLSWFGAPYYVVGRVDGVTLADPDTIASFSPEALRTAAQQAMTALAGIHAIDHARPGAYLGTFRGLREDVPHWERFEARAADRDKLLPLFPRVRDLLLGSMPADFTVGLYHGDFQFQNLMYAPDGTLLAVIDWELCGIGPTLNDLGWMVAFHDRPAWGPVPRPSTVFADAADLKGHYVAALGHEPAQVDWFEALSLYKYAAISGFNLMLHRRGKRVDPVWEERAPGVPCNLEHCLRLLGG
jgi:aminoglycoside phosphotransferase (APT) family kinase protein